MDLGEESRYCHSPPVVSEEAVGAFVLQVLGYQTTLSQKKLICSST